MEDGSVLAVDVDDDCVAVTCGGSMDCAVLICGTDCAVLICGTDCLALICGGGKDSAALVCGGGTDAATAEAVNNISHYG